ncbi:MAG: RHS repeat-associated core domain-containing protein, partial [Acidobacteriota bacterium]
DPLPSENRRNARLTPFLCDPNGNLIVNAEGEQFSFNGENKQTEVKDSQNNTIGKYYYDGDGKRVKKVTASETVVFAYSGGKLVAEYSSATPTASPNTYYTTIDYLGSPRVITDRMGTVISRRDFMPFGEELFPDATYRLAASKYGVNDNIRQRFTGYQKDDETGLDFAEARMYKNEHARFTAIDPLLASGKSDNPQTFNRFVYAGNNPILRTDPTGEDWIIQVNREKVGKREVNVSRPVWIPKGEAPSIAERAPHIWEADLPGGKGYQALDRDNERASAVFATRGEAEAVQSGWATQKLAGSITQGVEDGLTGIAKGAGNAVIGTVNSLTNPLGPAGAMAGVPNPLEVGSIPYDNATQASYGSATETGIAAGTVVTGGALSGGRALSVVPETTAARAPSFLGQANGPSIAVPNGASPTALVNRQGSATGFAFTGGRGGNGLNDAVTGIRVMNPTPRYPNGYVTYMGNGRQGVNPLTGRTIPNSDPLRHIPLNPR